MCWVLGSDLIVGLGNFVGLLIRFVSLVICVCL